MGAEPARCRGRRAGRGGGPRAGRGLRPFEPTTRLCLVWRVGGSAAAGLGQSDADRHCCRANTPRPLPAGVDGPSNPQPVLEHPSEHSELLEAQRTGGDGGAAQRCAASESGAGAADSPSACEHRGGWSQRHAPGIRQLRVSYLFFYLAWIPLSFFVHFFCSSPLCFVTNTKKDIPLPLCFLSLMTKASCG